MMDLKKLLHDSDSADAELNRKIDETNERIDEFATQTSPTYNSAISAKTGKVMVIGNVVFVDLRITTTAAINEWTDIMTGLLAPANAVNLTITASSVSYDLFMNANNGFLQTKKTMPAGTYSIKYWYIIK